MWRKTTMLLCGGWVSACLMQPVLAGDGRREIDPSMIPLTITSPGSYVVTGNLLGGSGQNGIVVNSDGVTIDLNGFELAGSPESMDGIVAPNSNKNIRVLNGVVRNWGDDGVDLYRSSICLLKDLQVSFNTDQGIRVGDGSLVQGCSAYQNGGTGIALGEGSVISECIARNNQSSGIVTSNSCVISDCVARENGGDGIRSGMASTFRNCVTRSNGDSGILAGAGSQIGGCVAYQNSWGIQITERGANVVGCAVFGNHHYGVALGAGGSVLNSTATENVDGGFQATTNCYLFGNNSFNNGTNATAPGFYITGRGNRIDSNHAGNNGIGFQVAGSSNLVIRNSAGANTSEYAVVGGNLLGTLTNSAAVSNAWVNFDL